MFSPNPATGETTLSIESVSAEKTIDENIEWELEVYAPGQLLKEKKTKLKGSSTILNTYGWQEGVYIVRVKYRDEVLQGKGLPLAPAEMFFQGCHLYKLCLCS